VAAAAIAGQWDDLVERQSVSSRLRELTYLRSSLIRGALVDTYGTPEPRPLFVVVSAVQSGLLMLRADVEPRADISGGMTTEAVSVEGAIGMWPLESVVIVMVGKSRAPRRAVAARGNSWTPGAYGDRIKRVVAGRSVALRARSGGGNVIGRFRRAP